MAITISGNPNQQFPLMGPINPAQFLGGGANIPVAGGGGGINIPTAADFQQFGVPTSPTDPIQTPTGLRGSELALGGGVLGALGQLNLSGAQGQQFLQQALGGVSQSGTGAQQFLANALRSGGTATQQSLAELRGAETRGLGAINQPISQALGGLTPFTAPGGGASALQAAFSGASGQPAQQQAFQNFLSSPNQAFLQEQGEQSILRNAAALGGLGGGNIQKDLIRFGQGLSTQDLDRQLQQLGIVSDRALTAQGQRGGLLSTQAALGGELIGRTGQLASEVFQTGADRETLLARTQADVSQETGRQRADIFGRRAGLAEATGARGAEALFQTGRDLAAGRTTAGRDIADAISATTTALTGLAEREGLDLQEIVAGGDASIANFLSGLTTQQSQSLQQLAGLLANISTGTGSTITGLPSIPGVQQTEGTLSDIARIVAAIGEA